MRPDTSPTKVKIAWAVAVGIDALQVMIFPTTVPGGFSVVEWILDLLAMGVLWALLGWSWAFLPSFVMELVPFIDMTPTWTLAVLIATRGAKGAPPIAGMGAGMGSGMASEDGDRSAKPPPKVVEAVVLPDRDEAGRP
jgi:hypothetical protein